MYHMHIMVGVPGSGKSTIAKEVMTSYQEEERTAVICSADDFFTDSDGVYTFRREAIGQAHAQCFAKAVKAAQEGIECIIIDNTNISNVERAPYYQLAQAFGYDVTFVFVGSRMEPAECHARCVHNVPLDTIRRMDERREQPLPFWTFNRMEA